MPVIERRSETRSAYQRHRHRGRSAPVDRRRAKGALRCLLDGERPGDRVGRRPEPTNGTRVDSPSWLLSLNTVDSRWAACDRLTRHVKVRGVPDRMRVPVTDWSVMRAVHPCEPEAPLVSRSMSMVRGHRPGRDAGSILRPTSADGGEQKRAAERSAVDVEPFFTLAGELRGGNRTAGDGRADDSNGGGRQSATTARRCATRGS